MSVRTAIFLCLLLVQLAVAFNSFARNDLFYRRRAITNQIRTVIARTPKRFSRNSKLFDVVQNMEGVTEAFVGGTVGVMSVMICLELTKKQEQGLEGCPYCLGNGEILCAICCGCGISGSEEVACAACNGRGLVKCISCKGDGRITPIILQSRATRDPEFASDGIGIDSP